MRKYFCIKIFSLFLLISIPINTFGNEVQPFPVINLSTNLNDIRFGESFRLNWESQNTNACKADGDWSGVKEISGSEMLSPQSMGQKKFILTCDGPGGTASEELSIDVYKIINGIVVDGYIRDAKVFIDNDNDFDHDIDEFSTISDELGVFKLRSGDTFISRDGFDAETGNNLRNFLMISEYVPDNDSLIISPVTSAHFFFNNKDIFFDALALDEDIDIKLVDPIANLDKGTGYVNLYEKGLQLGILSFSLQNIINLANQSDETTKQSFKIITEELEKQYLETQTEVDLSSKEFLTILFNVLSENINSQKIEKLIILSSEFLKVANLKEAKEGNDAILDFAYSTLQDDYKKILDEVLSDQDYQTYKTNIIKYIAVDQNIDEVKLTSKKAFINNSPPYITSSTTFYVDENTTFIGEVTIADDDTDASSLNVTEGDGSSMFYVGAGGPPYYLYFYDPQDYEAFQAHGCSDVEPYYNYDIDISDGTSVVTETICMYINDIENEKGPVFLNSANFSRDILDSNIGEILAIDPDGDYVQFYTSDNKLEIEALPNPYSAAYKAKLKFKSNVNYETLSSLTSMISASDGLNETNQSITITAANLPPEISSNLINLDENIEDIPLNKLSVTDPDGDNLTVTIKPNFVYGIDVALGNNELLPGYANDYEEIDTYTTLGNIDGTPYTLTSDYFANNVKIISDIILSDGVKLTAYNTVWSDADNPKSIFIKSGIFHATNAKLRNINIKQNTSGEVLITRTSIINSTFEPPGSGSSNGEYLINLNYFENVNAGDLIDIYQPDNFWMTNNVFYNTGQFSISLSSSSRFSLYENIFVNSNSQETYPSWDYDQNKIGHIKYWSSNGNQITLSANQYLNQNIYAFLGNDDLISENEYFGSSGILSERILNGIYGTSSTSGTIANLRNSSLDEHELNIKAQPKLIFENSQFKLDFPADYEANHDQFMYTLEISDGINETVIENLQINISDVNESPLIISNSSFSVEENNDEVGDILVLDPENDDLAYSVDTNSFTFQDNKLYFSSSPDFEQQSSYSPTITISDGLTSTSQSLTISVTNVDETPEFTSSSTFEVPENRTRVGEVTATDGDGDDVLIYTNDADFYFDDNNILFFNTAPDYESFTETELIIFATDGTNIASETFSITITNLDDEAPIFTSNSSFTADENQNAIGTVSATDDDSDDSLITFSISGSDIDIDSSSGVMTFNSSPDYETQSSYSATITASDGTNSRTQDITVDISNLNDNSPIFITSATFSVAENESDIGTTRATDADGDTLTYTISGSDISIDSYYGTMSFNAAPDYENDDTSYAAIVTVSDGENITTQVIAVVVTDTDDEAPVLSSTEFYVDENETEIGFLSATDIDSDDSTITYQLSFDGSDTRYSNLRAISTSGELYFNSAADYEDLNEYRATVILSDNNGSGNYNYSSTDITVYINDLDDEAPTFTSGSSFTIDENSTEVGSIVATDIDTDDSSITYSISGDDFSIDELTGLISFNSAPNFESQASYTATVTASDGNNTSSQNIEVSVNDINEAPTINANYPTNFLVDENAEITTYAVATACISSSSKIYLTCSNGTVNLGGSTTQQTISDEDGDSLSYSLSGDDADKLDISSGSLYLVASGDYETQETYNFTISVSDGEFTTSKDLTVTFANVNEKPTFTTDAALLVDENETSVQALSASDPEDDSIEFSLAGNNDGDTGSFTIDSSSGLLSFRNAPDYETKTSYEVYVYATDPSGSAEYELKVFTVSVLNINDNTPTFTSDSSFSMDENSTSAGSVSASDADGDTISFSTTSSDISINSSTGAMTFNAAPDYESITSFTADITASDGTFSSTESVTISINDVNDVSPTINVVSFSVDENETSIGTLSITDPDTNNSFSYSSNNSDIDIDTSGVMTFNSAPDYESSTSYTATITVNDGENSTSELISISIIDLDDETPVITSSLNYYVNENTTSIGTITATDSDADSIISFSIDSAADGILSIDSSTGAMVWDVPKDYESSTDGKTWGYQVYATDGTNTSDEHIHIYLNNNNDNDHQLTGDNLSVNENDNEVGTISFRDLDIGSRIDYCLPESSVLTFQSTGTRCSSTGYAGSGITWNHTDTILTSSTYDFENDSSFTTIITAEDYNTNDEDPLTINTQTHDINVTIVDVDEAPVFTNSTQITIDENETTVTQIVATDDDGDAITYSLYGSDSQYFSIDENTGDLSLLSAADYESKSSYISLIVIADSVTNSTNLDLDVFINDINEAPTFTSSSTFNVDENETSIGTVVANDPDGDSLTYYIYGGADQSLITINSSSGVLNFVSAANYEDKSEYVIDVTVSDGSVSLTETVTISINDINEAPSITSSASFTMSENSLSIGTIEATDEDNDTLTFSTTSTSASIDSDTGVLAFNSNPSFESQSFYSIDVTVSDGELSDSQTLSVSVANIDGISQINEIYLCSYEDTQSNYCASNSVLDASNDGSKFVVGMPNIDTVKVYAKSSSGDWSQQGPDITGVSAERVDISGDGTRIIFLSYGDIYAYDGIVTVKEYDSVLDDWIDVGSSLTNPGSGWRGWGSGVAIDEDGDTIVIGAGYADVPDTTGMGAIKIFNYDDSSSDWIEISSYGSLVENWMEGYCSSNYCSGIGIGYDVDINNAGDVVIASGTGNGFGWARVFYKLSNTWYMRCYQNTTGNGDTCYSSDDRFSYPGYNKSGGFSAAIKGDSTIDDIVVTLGGPSDNAATDFSQGDPIHTRTWTWNPGYNNSYNWEPYAPDVTRTYDNDQTGRDVSLSDDGSVLIVAAPYSTDPNGAYTATASGEVKIYSLSNMVTTEVQSVSISENYNQTCGHSIDVNGNGDFLFVSCPGYNDYPADNRGRVLIYSVEIDDTSDGVPSFTSDATFYVDENETSIGTVIASDPDGDTLEYSITHDDIEIDSSSGALTFSAAKDYESDDDTYTATIFVTDGTSYSSQDITIYLTNVNDNDPIISSTDTFTVNENETSIGTVVASDADGNSITFSISGSDISIDSTTGVMTFGAAPDYETQTSYSATVTASDGTNSTEQAITVTISDLDDAAPTFTSSSTFSADENQTTIGTVTATDSDTSDLFITFSTTSSDISIDTGSGVMTFNSAPDYEIQNSYSLTVTASDDTNTSTQDITVLINNLNDNAPVISSDATFSVDENQTAIGTVTASDEDSDTLTYSISGSDISIDSSTGVMTFDTAPDYETQTSYSATVTASDGTNSEEQAITISINDVDEAPSFTSSSTFSVDENQTAIGTVTASDPENDSLTYSISSSDISIDSSTGVMTFDTAPDYETQTSYSATVTASDGTNSSTQDITVSINNLNDNAPVISSDATFSVDENQTAIGTVTASDPENDSLTYSISSSDISIDSSTGVMTFDTAPDYETQTSYSATVTVSDGTNSSTQDITISINNLNDNPVSITNDLTDGRIVFSVNENQINAGTITVLDLDGDATFSLSGDDDTDSFYIDSSSGGITFKLPPDYETKAFYQLGVTVTDGTSSAVSTVRIYIQNLNDNDPEIYTTSFNRDEISWLSPDCDTDYCLLVGNIDASDADHVDMPDSIFSNSFSFEYEILDELDSDYFTIDSDGDIRFSGIPDYETASSYEINIKVTDYAYLDDDGDGTYEDTSSTTELVTVTLNEVNEPPYITSSKNISFNENENVVTTVTAIDPESGNNITIWFSIGCENGPCIGDGTGAGADDGLFSIDNLTGELEFIDSSFDFEDPSDSDADGIYEVAISTVLEHSSYQNPLYGTEYIYLTTSDVNEAPYIKSISSNWSSESSGGNYVSFSASVLEDEYSPMTYLDLYAFDDDCSYYARDDTKPFGDYTDVTFTGTDSSLISISTSKPKNGSEIECYGGSYFASTGFGIYPTDGYDYETKSQYDFVLNLSDGVNSNSYPVVIYVVDVDEAPVFTGDTSFTSEENSNSGFTIDASDPQGDDVTFSIVGGTDAELFSIDNNAGSQLQWAAGYAPDYESQTSATLVIQATDGTNSTNQEFTITITDANDNPPVITSSGTYNVDENESIVGTVDVTDPDGGPLSFTFSASAENSNLIIDSSTGVISFNTIPNYEDGVTQFTNQVTVTDNTRKQIGDGTYTDTQSIVVNLVDVDEAPSFTSSSTFSVDENETAIGTVTASDPENDSLTYSISSSDISIDSSTGVMTFNSAPDYETQTSYSATVTASDGTNSSTQAITVSINNLNDNAPSISTLTYDADELSTNIFGTLSASDADGDSLSYSIDSSDISVDASSGFLSFNSEPDYETQNSYTALATVSDGTFSTSEQISISINDINESPTITSTTFNAYENQTGIGTISASDPEGNTPTYSINSSDIQLDGSVLSFITAPDYETQTSYTVSVDVSDNGSFSAYQSSSQDITINIVNENDTPPVISTTELNVNHGETLVGTISASDPDGEAITEFNLINEGNYQDADYFSITNQGVLSLVSAADYSTKNVYYLKIYACDNNTEYPGLRCSNWSETTVNVNQPPVADTASFEANLKLPEWNGSSYDTQYEYTFQLTSSAADGRDITYSLLSSSTQPDGSDSVGSVSVSSEGILTYTYSEVDPISETYYFSINDGYTDSETATITIDIKGDPYISNMWHVYNTGNADTFASSGGKLGAAVNVGSVLNNGYSGDGILISIVDSGLELAHEDLVDNIVDGSWDYLGGDNDPTNIYDNSGDHGTSVAGLAAAAGWNDKGGMGIAPNASLIGHNFLQYSTSTAESDSLHPNAPSANSLVKIFNMSYGTGYSGSQYYVDYGGLSESLTESLAYGTGEVCEDYIFGTNCSGASRDGSIYIKSAGNGHKEYASSSLTTYGCGEDEGPLNVGYLSCTDTVADARHSLPYTIVVGALNNEGVKSSYSTTGSALWVSAPGGEYGIHSEHFYNSNKPYYNLPAMIAPDQSGCTEGYVGINSTKLLSSTLGYNDFEYPYGYSENSNCSYTSTFNGTSSAAPVVSGAVALLLEVNSNLTFRDIKHILASTSEQVNESNNSNAIDSHSLNGITQYEWVTNAAGYSYHNWYGFGAIDIDAAINLAENYPMDNYDCDNIYNCSYNLGLFASTGEVSSSFTPGQYFDYNSYLDWSITVTEHEHRSSTRETWLNEKVEFVRVNIYGEIDYMPAMGLRLQSPSGTIVNILQPFTNISHYTDYMNFDIGVSAFYGEDLAGQWTLMVDDYLDDGLSGKIYQWKIEIYGN